MTDRGVSVSLLRLLPAIVWMALIFGLSSRQDFPTPGGISVDIQAVLAHLFLFGVLAALIWLGLGDPQRQTRRFPLVVIGFVTLYGITDEIHQAFVPGRTSSLFDVIVDALAAVLVVVALQRLRTWRQAGE